MHMLKSNTTEILRRAEIFTGQISQNKILKFKKNCSTEQRRTELFEVLFYVILLVKKLFKGIHLYGQI